MADQLLIAFVFLVAGVVAVPIAARFGLGSVLGYLIAGVAISPILALLHVDLLTLQHVAEFGVVMMLFLVGLELEPRLLWRMRHRLLGLGGLQVAGTTAAVMAVAIVLGLPWQSALAVGLIFALSSTAIVLQTLNEKGLMRSDGGQAGFSVLLFQDIAVIPMLAFLPLLALPDLVGGDVVAGAASGDGHEGGDAGHGGGISLVDGLPGWQTTLITIAAVSLVIAAGNYLTTPLFRFIAVARLRELFTATALLLVIAIALLMSLVGLSPALGTFIAGVVLANSEYRHELESDIDPFRGLLLGLFFMTVGAAIPFDLLFANLASILALTLGLMALKAGVLLVLAWAFRLRGADRWLFALGLAQAGEFGFVLISFALTTDVLPADLAARLSLIVALSMLLTPALFIGYERLIAPRFAVSQAREAEPIDHKGVAIIAGHGRFGGIVNRMMRAAGYTCTVVDYSDAQLRMLRSFGLRAYYGDATRPDLLHAAGIEEAKLFVAAIDGKEQLTELVRYVVKSHPHVHVIARAVDREHVYELWSAGCRDIIRETYDSSLRAGRSALEAMGLSRDQAQRFAAEFERVDRASMVELADLYDIDTPMHQNAAYVARVREMMEEWEAQLRGQAAIAQGGGDAPEPDGDGGAGAAGDR